MAGTWVALIEGFGGLRGRDGTLRFAPQLPQQWRRLKFSLEHRQRSLDVDIGPDETVYSLRAGDELTVSHWGTDVSVRVDAPARLPTGRPDTT
jgi:alpha,alpha-trehalose phosphorylase